MDENGIVKPDWYCRIELTPRLKETLQLLASGYTDQQIALEMDFSPETAKRNRKDLREIFNSHNTTEMVTKAVALGFVDVQKIWANEPPPTFYETDE
jgi:DNA-binding CsgD family transcriptional regulator